MEKNIIELFAEAVVTELKKALAERRKNNPDENSAMVRFNVAEVLKTLGASFVNSSLSVHKDYAWLRVEASKNGFYYPIDFGQRRQATRAEMDTAASGDVDVKEAICVAGIYQDEEGDNHYSMKWDSLFTKDGEGFAFSGPVRKYKEGIGYDGPVVGE